MGPLLHRGVQSLQIPRPSQIHGEARRLPRIHEKPRLQRRQSQKVRILVPQMARLRRREVTGPKVPIFAGSGLLRFRPQPSIPFQCRFFHAQPSAHNRAPVGVLDAPPRFQRAPLEASQELLMASHHQHGQDHHAQPLTPAGMRHLGSKDGFGIAQVPCVNPPKPRKSQSFGGAGREDGITPQLGDVPVGSLGYQPRQRGQIQCQTATYEKFRVVRSRILCCLPQGPTICIKFRGNVGGQDGLYGDGSWLQALRSCSPSLSPDAKLGEEAETSTSSHADVGGEWVVLWEKEVRHCYESFGEIVYGEVRHPTHG